MTIEFNPWPKTPRLYRNVVITEKIDGSNGAVIIREVDPEQSTAPVSNAKMVYAPSKDTPEALKVPFLVAAQSRRRIITPYADNHGFASWVWEHAEYLAATLGEGHHYGEWWGVGIQRGYNMSKRVFSLFNLRKWGDTRFGDDQLRTVPVLYRGEFSDYQVNEALGGLIMNGSQAAPGYTNPEGICVFHEDSNQVFKVPLVNRPKSAVEALSVADWFTADPAPPYPVEPVDTYARPARAGRAA